MEQLLAGQRAIVTGGSRGIGFEIARAMVEAGAEVLVCGRSRDALEAADRALRAGYPEARLHSTVADVSSPTQVEALFRYADEHMGALDILVNNAGSGVFRPVAELSVEEWDTMIGTNLSGTFYCSREALQRFLGPGRRSGPKWIVNISSLAAKNPFAGGAAYNASKFGLNGFSEALMLDHRHEEVRVTTSCRAAWTPASMATKRGRSRPGRSRLKILQRSCWTSSGCRNARLSAASKFVPRAHRKNSSRSASWILGVPRDRCHQVKRRLRIN